MLPNLDGSLASPLDGLLGRQSRRSIGNIATLPFGRGMHYYVKNAVRPKRINPLRRGNLGVWGAMP
jgi:hypothetical protein